MKNDDCLIEIPYEHSFRRLNVLDRGCIIQCRSRGTRVLLSSATRLAFRRWRLWCRMITGVRRYWQWRLRGMSHAGRRAGRFRRTLGHGGDVKVLTAARAGRRADVGRVISRSIIVAVLIVVVIWVILLSRSELAEVVVAVGLINLCRIIVCGVARRQICIGRGNFRRWPCRVCRSIRSIKWRCVLLHAKRNERIKRVMRNLFFSGSNFRTCYSNYNSLAYGRCKRLNFEKLLCLLSLYKRAPGRGAKARAADSGCRSRDLQDFLVRFLLDLRKDENLIKV